MSGVVMTIVPPWCAGSDVSGVVVGLGRRGLIALNEPIDDGVERIASRVEHIVLRHAVDVREEQQRLEPRIVPARRLRDSAAAVRGCRASRNRATAPGWPAPRAACGRRRRAPRSHGARGSDRVRRGAAPRRAGADRARRRPVPTSRARREGSPRRSRLRDRSCWGSSDRATPARRRRQRRWPRPASTRSRARQTGAARARSTARAWHHAPSGWRPQSAGTWRKFNIE